MAFSPEEQSIIEWGQKNGKNVQEIKDAVFRFRTTGSPKDPSKSAEDVKEGGFLEQVREAAQSGISRVQQGFEQAQTTESPIGAVESGLKVGSGAIQTVTAPLAPLLKPLQDLIGFISGKVSDTPEVQKFADSPAGEITSRVAEDIADVTTIAGAAMGGRAAPRIAGAVSNTAQKTATALQGISETGTLGIQRATSQALDPTRIMQRVARLSKGNQQKFQKLANESVGEYLVNRGIFGTVDEITTQLFERFQKSKNTADDAFARLDERTTELYKPTPVGSAIEELFAREIRVSTPGALSKDFARVRQLKQKYENEGLNMSEINEVKRIYERNVRLDFLKENKPESVARATNLDSAIRQWQFAQAEKLGLKNLKDINKETQLAKQLLDDLGKEHAGQLGNNAITLTDWIIVSELDPTAIGALLVKKGLSDKGLQSAIAKKLAGEPTQPDIFPVFENVGQTIDSYADWIRSIEKTTP